MASASGVARSSTLLAASRSAIAGRNSAATERYTSTVSSALQTLGRWTLAFSTMSTARARSALSSTNTWQMPIPPVITGIVACSRQRRCSAAPPRGMIMSTYLSSRSSSVTSARSGSVIVCTAAAAMPDCGQRVLDHLRERQVAVERLAAPAQDRGVAGLEAEGGDVDGDVRPRLVDHADDADGDAPLAQPQAVREHAAIVFRADRIGQRGDAARVVGERGQPLLVQQQPVEQRLAQSLGAAGRDVLAFAASTVAACASSASAIASSAAFFLAVDKTANCRLAARAAWPI